MKAKLPFLVIVAIGLVGYVGITLHLNRSDAPVIDYATKKHEYGNKFDVSKYCRKAIALRSGYTESSLKFQDTFGPSAIGYKWDYKTDAVLSQSGQALGNFHCVWDEPDPKTLANIEIK